jgi:hypothetical protein
MRIEIRCTLSVVAAACVLDHAILEYALPFIDRVKVRLEARLD